MEGIFGGATSIEVHALCLGDRIDLRGISGEVIATGPLLVRAGRGGCVAVFRYGCVVLFNVSGSERESLLAHVASLVSEPLDEIEHEELVVELSTRAPERIDNGKLALPEPDVAKVQLVAHALAKSVALNHYEALIAEAFQQVEPLARRLKDQGSSGQRPRQLISKIGAVLLLEHGLVGRAEVAEQPELLWEEPQLEGLYAKLQDEYELKERSGALERKLRLLVQTSGIFIDLLHNKRSLRVEWYIVALIVVEIVILVYEMFFHV